MLWSKAASAEARFKRLRTEAPCSWGVLFLRRWLESPGSACCTAMLLQITTICILGRRSPVACPPLRQSLSPGWPVRPGLGCTDKIKEVKEKIQHLPLEARLLKGHHAEQCCSPWPSELQLLGKPFAPSSAWLHPHRRVLGCPAGFKFSQRGLGHLNSCKWAASGDIFK